jgi:hypothetical protein
VKINGRCRVCNREFPIDVLVSSDAAGHCPFCGTPLDAHYGAMLVNALAAVQAAGSALEHALDALGHYGPNLELDVSTILEPIEAALTQRATRRS